MTPIVMPVHNSPDNMSSFVTVYSDVVIAHCKSTIARIEKERARLDKKYLDDHRRPVRKYWLFGKILRMQSDEEVKQNTACFENIFAYPSIYGWGTMERAKSLLNAAHAAPMINITTEDWERIA